MLHTLLAIALGLALLFLFVAALLAAEAQWRGVKPEAETPKFWRWAYYWAHGVLVLGVAAMTAGVLLWLAYVLGIAALRLTP